MLLSSIKLHLHQVCIDEVIYFTVHDRLNIARFLARPVILNHGIGLENVAPYLAAPFDFLELALYIRHVLEAFALLYFEELTAKHAHCRLSVLYLAALVLALHDDACREMGDADSGGGLIDMLTARAARPICIDTDIIGIYLDVV